MRRLLNLILVFFVSLTFAQQGDGGTPQGIMHFSKNGIAIPFVSFPQPDIEKLIAEDQINDSSNNAPWRFGFNYETDLNFDNSGEWVTRENGDKVWFLKIVSNEAKTINLTFSNTVIPEGNELYVYAPDRSFVLGKFTEKHIYEGELGTELIPGNEVIVEYLVPFRNTLNKGNINVSKVTHGYRTASEYELKIFGSSKSCNMNVNCPDGAPYKDQRNSVVMLVSGSSGFCTGALINNTAYDGKPYVLTANHCYNQNIASWIFRFNWQSAGCDNPTESPGFMSLSGAELKSRRQTTDFCLVEIMGGLENGTVPETHTPYFAGWDKTDAIPQRTIGIHHPSGDIKKISFDDDAPIVQQVYISGTTSDVDGVFKVTWDRNTVTEGGSSGSPLFNNKGQIIGQLWGGSSGCGNAGTNNAYDFYGRIHKSWEPTASTQANQLKHWLDPNNTAQPSIYGFDPYEELLTYDVVALAILEEENVTCSESFAPKIEIMNKGTSTLTSLEIHYSYNGIADVFNWTGSLATYDIEVVTLPMIVNNSGNNLIQITLVAPNGNPDEDDSDNLLSFSFEAFPEYMAVDFEFYTSCWPEENSWILADDNENTIYSGGNYPTGSNANFLIKEQFCLDNGCYELILLDSQGDGVSGGTYNNCDYFGSMTLTQVSDGTILAHLAEEDGNFGYEISYNFCINEADLSDKGELMEVAVFPNPSYGEFNVVMAFPGEKELVLTNLEGRIITFAKTAEEFFTINETNLSSGIYLLTVSNASGSTTKKLVIQ